MEEKRMGNTVELCGILSGRPQFSHLGRNKSFYPFPLSVSRLSGVEDTINIICEESLLDITIPDGIEMLHVRGELRSYNNKSGVGNKLVLFVYAHELKFSNDKPQNEIYLLGTLCKSPVLRLTPLGREICDLLVAVNRPFGHSDYLPCICWGQNASMASRWAVGDLVELEGRIQSRNYVKNVNEGQVNKTTFEVSATSIHKIV